MCNTAGIDNQRASGANIAANCRTIFLNNLPAPGGYNCCVSFPAALDILRSAVDIGACGYAIIINILCATINYGICPFPATSITPPLSIRVASALALVKTDIVPLSLIIVLFAEPYAFMSK